MPPVSADLVRFILSLGLQPLFLIGLGFYASSALVWFAVISREGLSGSYPLLVGLTFALVTLGAIVFFDEQVGWVKLVGVVVILGGIIIVSRS